MTDVTLEDKPTSARHANFSNASFTSVNFTRANLKGANFTNTQFGRSAGDEFFTLGIAIIYNLLLGSIKDLPFVGNIFYEAVLDDADFSGAHLSYVLLDGASKKRTVWRDVSHDSLTRNLFQLHDDPDIQRLLTEGKVSSNNFRGASLAGMSLSDIDFRGADFRNCDLN